MIKKLIWVKFDHFLVNYVSEKCYASSHGIVASTIQSSFPRTRCSYYKLYLILILTDSFKLKFFIHILMLGMLVALESLWDLKWQTAMSEYCLFSPVCSQHADRTTLHYWKFLFHHLPVIPHLSTNSSDCGIWAADVNCTSRYKLLWHWTFSLWSALWCNVPSKWMWMFRRKLLAQSSRYPPPRLILSVQKTTVWVYQF